MVTRIGVAMMPTYIGLVAVQGLVAGWTKENAVLLLVGGCVFAWAVWRHVSFWVELGVELGSRRSAPAPAPSQPAQGLARRPVTPVR